MSSCASARCSRSFLFFPRRIFPSSCVWLWARFCPPGQRHSAASGLAGDLWGLAGQMGMEIGIGLMLGFVSRMIFFALEIAGAIVGIEIGLAMPPA